MAESRQQPLQSWPFGEDEVPSMLNWRTALMRVHERLCRPAIIPVLKIFTMTAWTIAVIAMLYAYVAGQ